MVVYAVWMFSETEDFCNGKEAKDGICISATVRTAGRGADAGVLADVVGEGSTTVCRARSGAVGTRWASSTSPRSWDVRRGPSSGEPTNSTSCRPIPPRDGCGVRVPVEKKDRVRAGTRTESEIGSGGPHRRGPRRERRAVDGPLAAADCGGGDGHGNAGQSAGRARLDGRAKAGATQDREGSGRRPQPRSGHPVPADRRTEGRILLRRATPCFPSIPRRKNISDNSFARAACGRSRRSGRSTTTFPVGPPA